jgi:hypothetical protein
MMKSNMRLALVVLSIWSMIVVALFLQTAGISNFKPFSFPVAKGNLLFLKVYNAHNILARGQTVISIPHGIPFVHPARTERLAELSILTSFTLEEAMDLIDGKSEKFVDHGLTYKNILLLKVDDKFWGVPAVNPASGNIVHFPNWPQYSSRLLGASVEEARSNIDELLKN